MKYVKTLGLGAIAAAALMAFVGASTASATVLCSVQPTEGSPATKGTVCPANFAYLAGTEIHATAEEHIVLTTGSEFTEITCKHGTLLGDTENEGSATETVKIKVTKTTWEECSTPNGSCTVTTLKPGVLEVHWIADTYNGTLTANGKEITTSCNSIFGNIHCIFKFESEDLGTITGGNPATIDKESTPINTVPTSSLCPAGPTVDGKFEITTPKPLYVASHT